jgi:2-keto-myo-inositol isomerase
MINLSNFGLNRIICPSYNIEAFFQLTYELGFNYIELRNDLPGKSITDTLTVRETNMLSERYNIKICTINALQRFNNPQELRIIKDELIHLSEVAKVINCPAIVFCPMNSINDFRSPKEQFRDTVDMLIGLAPILKQYNIMGYIEPLGFKSSSLSSVITAMKAIKEVGYEGYKIVFDTFHHAIGPDNLKKFSDEYDVKLTGIIHISAVTSDIPIENYRDEHRNIDFLNDKMKSKEQIEYFIKNGYNGIVSFEPFSGALQVLEKEELKYKINRAIDYLDIR